MRSLAIMEQGLTLSVDGGLLSVERAGKVVEQVRPDEIQEILLFGAVSITPAAIAMVLKQQTDTVFLTARGRYVGRLLGRPSKNIELRLAQFERFRDPIFSLGTARGMIRGKIANQRNLLLRVQREQKRDDLAEVIGMLRVSLGGLGNCDDIEKLRGLEGQAAASYFRVLGTCPRNLAFKFSCRNRRPPRDPANAILSFGYTLLGTIMESFVLRVGMDPMLGVFHAPDYGRPSLMLDLIEEFRPVLVDSLMLRMINRREITIEDFEEPVSDDVDAWTDDADDSSDEMKPRGVWLNENGRRVFFRAWGRRLRETLLYPPRGQRLMLEEIMRNQVYHLARVIKGEEDEYQPFVPR